MCLKRNWKNNFNSLAIGRGSLPCLFINIWEWVFYLPCVFSKETVRSLEPKVFLCPSLSGVLEKSLFSLSTSILFLFHFSASAGDKSRWRGSTKSLFLARLRLSSPLAGCGCLQSGRHPSTHKGVWGSFGEGTGRLLFLIVSDTNPLFLQAQLLAIFW